MIREVLRMGDPRLWQKSQPITQFDTPELQELLRDMRDTMAHLNGAGLAAPQIGVPLRLVIFGVKSNPRYPGIDDVPDTVLINPVLAPLSDEIEEGWEGCLSVPGMRGWVPRFHRLRYSGFDEHGQRFERDAEGFHARVVQHEVDHLNGVLYPMRIRDFTERGGKIRLDRISADPPKAVTKEMARERFAGLGEELFDLQDEMWGAKVNSVLIVLQGRDSAGKDGAIKHVAGCLNPRGVRVHSFGVPTQEEREHDFLWRVHRHAPRLGEFAIFNRSHYEDVLVVRVHELVPRKLWRERYGHIADFEELLAEHGTIVLKYFLHISKKEQKERLLERERDLRSAWKLNPNDWKERAYWDEYTEAYEDAISKTAAPHAPWIVVPANAKWYRNLVVAESIVEALRGHRKGWRSTLEAMGRKARAGLADYGRTEKARPAPKPLRED